MAELNRCARYAQCTMCKNMRINTSGKQSWRTDLYERTADSLGESTKTGAIDSACIHANQDLDAKREAIEFLAGQLPPKQLQEVAKILSTDEIEISVSKTLKTSSTVSIDGRACVDMSFH